MSKYSYRLDGEPNLAWIFENFKGGSHTQRWFARIQLNGELSVDQQEEFMDRMIESLNSGAFNDILAKKNAEVVEVVVDGVALKSGMRIQYLPNECIYAITSVGEDRVGVWVDHGGWGGWLTSDLVMVVDHPLVPDAQTKASDWVIVPTKPVIDKDEPEVCY